MTCDITWTCALYAHAIILPVCARYSSSLQTPYLLLRLQIPGFQPFLICEYPSYTGVHSAPAKKHRCDNKAVTFKVRATLVSLYGLQHSHTCAQCSGASSSQSFFGGPLRRAAHLSGHDGRIGRRATPPPYSRRQRAPLTTLIVWPPRRLRRARPSSAYSASTLPAFEIPGGVILLLIGTGHAQARRSQAGVSNLRRRQRYTAGVVPWGVPMLAGPGAFIDR